MREAILLRPSPMTRGGRRTAAATSVLVDDHETEVFSLEKGFQPVPVADLTGRCDCLLQRFHRRDTDRDAPPCSPRAGLTTSLPCFSRKARTASRSSPTSIWSGTTRPARGDHAPRNRLVVTDRHRDAGSQFRKALAAMNRAAAMGERKNPPSASVISTWIPRRVASRRR